MVPFEILPLGDAALLVRMAERGDVESLLRARQAIAKSRIAGVGEVVIGYASIAVYLDPALIFLPADDDRMVALLTEALHAAEPSNAEATSLAQVEIPVCYDAEFALDLSEVARHARLPEGEVIRRHSEAAYHVRCVGFTPGFPYLSGLPPELATPRRETPRTKVPAGSVSIGGSQAGIYPAASPGGWNVIGRTPLRLFNPNREPLALLRAGDKVRFRRITREEFSNLAEARE